MLFSRFPDGKADMDPQVTIEARSPDLVPGAFPIVVTVPTFRRPEHLAATLASLERQTIAGRFAVIVMENDVEGGAGLEAARPFFETGRLPGLVIAVPERGNCSAYNGGWATALQTFPNLEHLAVIDDDEIADPHWAEHLLQAARTLGVDIVGGPQVPVFASRRGESLRRHPVFAALRERTQTVPILYSSGNVLIARRVLEAMPRPFLDPAFNFLGGGDSDFYARALAKGFRFGWCAEAIVRETMPERRTEFSWLHARALRNGAISTIIEQRQARGRLDHARSLAKSGALLLASPFRSLRLGLKTRSATIALYPMQVAVGRFQAVFGGVNEQYRRPDAN